MNSTVFTELKFWLLVAFSVVIPAGIYTLLLAKRVISRTAVLLFGFSLVGIAGIDVYLLQSLAALSKLTPSLADDAIFSSEISLGLYLLPAMFAGIGINIVSDVLVNHLAQAQIRFRETRFHANALS